MEKKFVFYNGGKDGIYPCSNPEVLEFGRKYEVIKVDARAFFTTYTLKGIKGQFNSCWFDEKLPKITLVASNKEPKKGDKLEGEKIIEENGNFKLQKGKTNSVIAEVYQIGENVYRVITEYGIVYIVQVL